MVTLYCFAIVIRIPLILRCFALEIFISEVKRMKENEIGSAENSHKKKFTGDVDSEQMMHKSQVIWEMIILFLNYC
jgi:hypothetical protein